MQSDCAFKNSAPTLLILAAGQGARYRASGGTTHKLDAMLDGVSVLEHCIRTARASGLAWHVVRAGADGGDGGASGAGMGDSIAAGVRATRHANGWLILPGDLPLVRAATLQQIARALQGDEDRIAVPHFAGQNGHPVGFGRAYADALCALSGDLGASSIVRSARAAQRVRDCAVEDEGIVTDIDTVADLERAEALLRQRAPAA